MTHPRHVFDFATLTFMNKSLFAVALSLCAIPVWAQTPAEPTVQSPASPVAHAFGKPKFLEAETAKVPARVRVGLPRGAKTVFCLKVPIEGKPALLHGWKVGEEGKVTMDIFSLAASRPSKRGRRTKRSAISTLRRLARVPLGGMESGSGELGVMISSTLFDTRAKRGAVLMITWPHISASFLSAINPMIVVTLPDGLRGRAYTQFCTTESDNGHDEDYEPLIGTNGRFFLMFNRQAKDAPGPSTQTPYVWDGNGYKAGKAIAIQ